ncbi:C-type lectin domain family 12 member B [Rhinolophus ferrumequinum]|uniref:C-type lectin domain family 12 member B n=1 Tax=Rhinolophus ferrumequinum TaxID=59479 RepID=A0A671EUU2_RHIFE|nr:C-type lectin domain family 12 member B [Rhinolophus ferrumequinum]KAF6339079.1 C-type lectin domain family 12 member B [Rhinolophus ferrumequinum]
MSEEVTYATLTFQDSVGAGNNQDRNNLRKRGSLAPSPIWRWAALSLLTLCLLLLIGLVTLGIMFLQTSNEINSDSEKLSQLQKIIHQQQDNFSQQLSNYRNFPMEKEFLKSQISNLLVRQGQMAVKLCQELVIHISDHKCNPCPKTWQWYQTSCYYFATNEEKTWTKSRKNCTDKNSTLVKIDSLEEKDFLKSQPLPKFSFFWLGLSWDPSGRNWLWEDGSIPSPSLFNTKEYAQTNGSKRCAYFQKGNIYISRCSAEISWICEKTAALVKIDDLD